MAKTTIEQVLACPTLPSLPAVAMQVVALTRDRNVNLKKIAELVQHDQALTGRILRTVNSSYYGLPKPCTTISRAIAYLGLKTVKSLVLGFSLIESIGMESEDNGFDYHTYWRRAVFSASAARILAEETGACDAEEALIAALLRDVGMAAMLSALKVQYVAVVRSAGRDHSALPAAETRAFGFDHAEVGARLAERWRLPRMYVSAIRHHHSPQRAPAQDRSIVRTVVLADLAADTLAPSADTSAMAARFAAQSRAWLGIGPERSDRLLQKINSDAEHLSNQFMLQTEDERPVRGPHSQFSANGEPLISTILADAREQLFEHQIATQAETRRLKQSNRALARESMTDGLTGVFNRRHFNKILREAFASAAESGESLALAFTDADRFKLINDTHGHQAGDAVLVEIARRCRDAIGAQGVVCRYGGEEFAAILPGVDVRTAAAIAETIRQSIEDAPIDVSGFDGPEREVNVTVSVGVAVLDDESRDTLSTADEFLNAADKAVYAAKISGRNCVRIFNPAPSSRRRSTQGVASTANSPSATTRLILVEDDDACANTILAALRNFPDVACIHVRSAEEAVAHLTRLDSHGDPIRNSPRMGTPAHVSSIVLCESDLPGMTGLEFAVILRKNERWRSIPLILLNGTEDPQAQHRSLAAGANACVSRSRFLADPARYLRQITEMWAAKQRGEDASM